MSDKLYIAYCTSGLGNRLRPLASAMAYCAMTGRKLRVYWDSITPNGCLTPLERLYENEFDFITLDEIAALEGQRSVGLFTEKGPGHGVVREAERFGRDQLLKLARHSDPQHAQALQLDDPRDVVIVYDNAYLASVPLERSIAALRSLAPKADIRAKVLAQAAEAGLSLATKGVHARGTDFNMKDALAQYSAVIRERIAVDQGEKFWLSTEDEQLEQGLRELFPSLVSRHDRLHLQLNEGKQVWGDPDSYTVSHDHGVDALTDIYLLSCVNLVVYHPGSTFAEISRHLHGVLQQPQAAGSAEQAFEQARAEFIEKAKQLVPRGDAVYPLEIETGAHGPVPPEQTSAAFMYWETLGYQIPFMERLFMNSFSGQPVLKWDGAVFNQLAALGFENFPRELFPRICPYPEAWSQMSTMRGYIGGKKVLVIGSETFWIELLSVMAGAAEVTTVEYRPIEWSEPPQAPLKTLTWDAFIGDLDAHKQRYDLILSYSSIEHSGLGRYGDRITPLGDLFTFHLMARCMKPSGLCTAAVPTGQDLTHFNAHRIYGEKRIRAMQHVSGLKFIGIAGPDAEYLGNDPAEALRGGWNLAGLAQLPLGQYRQPILCFGAPDFSLQRYVKG
jgi:hypothetical protein